MPLEESWVKRHIGLNHEYAEKLDDAERYYDAALSLYRKHANENTLDYANTVRYPAVIKNRVGKRDESTRLWEEACQRYEDVGIVEGVAEAAAHLTIFALENGDLPLAKKWFVKARASSEASSDPDTHKFIAEVGAKFDSKTE
jgi:tetratricopeptide (TPR) repeat protein